MFGKGTAKRRCPFALLVINWKGGAGNAQIDVADPGIWTCLRFVRLLAWKRQCTCVGNLCLGSLPSQPTKTAFPAGAAALGIGCRMQLVFCVSYVVSGTGDFSGYPAAACCDLCTGLQFPDELWQQGVGQNFGSFWQMQRSGLLVVHDAAGILRLRQL